MPAVLVPTRVPSRRSLTAPLNASHAEAQLRSVAFGLSGAVVESDLVAVGVGEGECPTEGVVDRCGDDVVTVGGESIVNGLDVCCVEPDRGTNAGLGNGCEIGAGNDVAECDAIGFVSKTTACEGPASERTRPRYCS